MKYFHLGVDGIVLPGNSGHGVHQHLQRIGGLGVAGGGVQLVIVAVQGLLIGVQGLLVGVENLLLVDGDLVRGCWGQVAAVGLGSRVVGAVKIL